MNKDDIEKVYNLYSNVWKERCSMFPNESTIGVIKKAPNRIVVIGDLHGDWKATINTLRKASLIDHTYNWIGKDTILVQLGDQIDRCRLDKGLKCYEKGATEPDEASDMKILQFFTELHNKASKVGGAVYSILGNHEIMNVDGDFRYVSRENILEFSGKNTKDSNKLVPFSGNGTIEEGFKNRKEYFKPGSKIANFLACTRKAALVIGKNLFIHAGIVPEIANKYRVDDINRIVALYLFDQLNNENGLNKNKFNDLLIDSTSVYWTRVLGNLNKKTNQVDIKKVCSSIFDSGVLSNLLGTKVGHKIERIFIGHTPQLFKGINTICDDRLYYVDVGISKAFDSYRQQNMFQNNPNRQSHIKKFQYAEIMNDSIVKYDKK
tara:strand:- start:392 stop:1525 length:1134 start_codon:yes stop_codon:yes gene_type:complete